MSIVYTILTALVGAAAISGTAYLCVLLASACRPRPVRPAFPGGYAPRLVVMVPAHNEEMVLAQTLRSLDGQQFSLECRETVVVADNCTDRTADIARAAGATVWERTNPDERGKGYALDWAVSRLLARAEPPDAVLVIDADTWAAPDFLGQMANALHAAGGPDKWVALQGRYGVLNESEGWRAALMSGAFDLVNHVRPLGRDRLGLSVGLKGNGMLFSRALLQKTRWRGDSVTEDLDYALLIAQEHGVRVGYVPEALVRAQMPTTAAQAGSQRARWEGGRYQLVREKGLPLLGQGVRRRSLLLTDCGLDLLCPPLAELAALLLVWAALVGAGSYFHFLPFAPVWAAGVGLTALGFCAYVLGGLRLSGAGADVYLSLLRAPFYALWKLALLAARPFAPKKKGADKNTQEWVRTERAPMGLPPETKL